MNANTGNPGLIGFGEWPRQAYAPVLKEMSNVRVHTVAARSGVTLQLACDTFGPQTVTTNDYRNLLENNGIDALMIALPNAMHAPVLTEAASAGKHIFFLNRRWRTTRTRLAGELAAPRMVSVCL